MKSIRLITLNAGEFLLMDDFSERPVLFDSVTDTIGYVRANWHPKAKQLHLRRRLRGPAEVLTEVMVFSGERRLMTWVDIHIVRPWRPK